MAINEEQVGGQITLTATGPQQVYGIVTALPAGLQVEAKPPRSSKWIRTIYGWGDVLAYQEGDDEGWAIVKTTYDVLEGAYIHDHTLIQLEDNGWYSIPQYDENAEDETGVVYVSSQAEVQIITDAFNKLADGTPTMKPSSRGRGRKKAEDDGDDGGASTAPASLPEDEDAQSMQDSESAQAEESQDGDEGPIAPKRRRAAKADAEDGDGGKKKKKKKKKKKDGLDDGWNE